MKKGDTINILTVTTPENQECPYVAGMKLLTCRSGKDGTELWEFIPSWVDICEGGNAHRDGNVIVLDKDLNVTKDRSDLKFKVGDIVAHKASNGIHEGAKPKKLLVTCRGILEEENGSESGFYIVSTQSSGYNGEINIVRTYMSEAELELYSNDIEKS